MKLQAQVTIENWPDDIGSDIVQQTLHSAVCEWLDYDIHPEDLTVTMSNVYVPQSAPVAPAAPTTPLYAISDLHFGDGGPRDNFAYGDHEKQLASFLDMVEDQRGQLVICGDLFELWQSNISRCLTKRVGILDRLARMGAIYILGNHDADLRYFIDSDWLTHPFFRTMCESYSTVIGDQQFHFIHGHSVDPYCAGDTPGIGRLTAIYSGLAEDKNGSPMLDKYRTVEDKVVGRLEKIVSLWERLCGKPDRFTALNRALLGIAGREKVIVCGHTHRPGHVGTLYNTGTWAERVNSFVRIDPNGSASVYDWDFKATDRATLNTTVLPC
jgi:UDP-2,3-diacylglucosamine pyrophosphatase LpxH